jgi:hypothetical protein
MRLPPAPSAAISIATVLRRPPDDDRRPTTTGAECSERHAGTGALRDDLRCEQGRVSEAPVHPTLASAAVTLHAASATVLRSDLRRERTAPSADGGGDPSAPVVAMRPSHYAGHNATRRELLRTRSWRRQLRQLSENESWL